MNDPDALDVHELARQIEELRSRREFLGRSVEFAHVVPVVASFSLFPRVSFAQAGGSVAPMGMMGGMM